MILALKRPTAGADTQTSYKRRRLEAPCKLLLQRPTPATTPEEAAATAEGINATQPLERHGLGVLFNLRMSGVSVTKRDLLIAETGDDTWTCKVLPAGRHAWSVLDMLIYNRQLMMTDEEKEAVVDFIAAEHLACRVVREMLRVDDVASIVIDYIDPTCRQPAIDKDAWLTAPTDIQESIYKTLTLEQGGMVNTLDLRSNITAFEPHMLQDDVDVDMDEDDPLYEAAREMVEQQFTARHRAYWHKLVNTLNKRADVFWARVSERL